MKSHWLSIVVIKYNVCECIHVTCLFWSCQRNKTIIYQWFGRYTLHIKTVLQGCLWKLKAVASLETLEMTMTNKTHNVSNLPQWFMFNSDSMFSWCNWVTYDIHIATRIHNLLAIELPCTNHSDHFKGTHLFLHLLTLNSLNKY